MKCPKCQCEVAANFKHCPECGTRVSTVSSGLEKSREIEVGEGVDFSQATREGAGEAGATAALRSEALGERYEMVEKVGEGGFGAVWRARDKRLDRTVAIKRLLAGKDARAMERFEREANLIAGLNHRNVVQVYDCGRDEQGPWIVMEWVGGGTLKALLKARGKLPVEEALGLMRGLCRGLSAAHRKNLVHRDIKPANILLERDGEEWVPKIVDFGLARGGTDSEASRTGFGMGTPYYMPPEQRRDAKGVNHTADLYALGKTFYEMLSGELPDTVDPEKVPSPELTAILLKCCKARPEERYFSAEDLLREVEKLEGRSSPTGMGVPVASSGNACPQCHAANPEGVKFCGKCGVGLTRLCPECEMENPSDRKFCGGCGTEIEAFDVLRGILTKMERHVGEKKWSRVLKEAELAKKEWRLPGKNGAQMREKAERLVREASGTQKEIARLCGVLEAAVQTEEWSKGVEALAALGGMGPEAGEHGERKADLVKRWDEQDWARAVKEAETLSESGDFAAAVCCYEAYAHAHPEGLHREEVSPTVELLKRQWDEKDWVNTCTSVESFGRMGKLRDAVACWQAYLKVHPQGAHVVEAAEAEDAWAWSAAETEVTRCEAKGNHVAAARALLGYLEGGYAQKKTTALESLVSQVEVMANSDESEILAFCTELKDLKFSTLDQARLSKAIASWNRQRIQGANAQNPFKNSLGMRFVPAGAPGVLFSVWDTRVKDYAAFARATNRAWDKPSFSQGEDHPAVNVSWDDATAFCKWLTPKERREGTLDEGQEYRLPTDAEWSVAVGDGKYPWGDEWPPPKGAGNYASSLKVDDFEHTSPVGSFAANRHGLYDMGGNVWEWCQDGEGSSKWVRGGSWGDDVPAYLASSCRGYVPSALRDDGNGFRCVLAVRSSR